MALSKGESTSIALELREVNDMNIKVSDMKLKMSDTR
jgi:hypothetical protein